VRRLVALAVAAGALVAVGAAGAVDPGHLVGQSSIGGARLGLKSDSYTKLLRERPFVTRFADGTSRLGFTKREVHVFLDRSGKAFAVFTNAREFRTASGAGPCAAVAALKRAYGSALRAYRSPTSPSVVAYRAGNLWFSVVLNGTIGSVTLASPSLPLSAVAGAPQCGTGEEGE